MEDLEVQPGVVIPGHELTEAYSRSGGPGGQHVNTTSSRVSLRWCPETSALRESVRRRLVEKLEGRLTSDGDLIVHADSHRSQLRNREDARARLAATVRAALVIPKVRRATRPSRRAKRRRVNEKKQRGDTKRLRGRVRDDG